MQIINNDIGQILQFADDRTAPNHGAAVDLSLEHIATDKTLTFDNNTVTDSGITIDASTLRNGLHIANISNNLDSLQITSFIVQVIDINSLNLTENNYNKEIGYKNN